MLTQTSPEITILSEQARQVLQQNDRGGYTVPSSRLYPFQWNWDSCFCALGWSRFDEQRAWKELDMLFAGQWQDGMLPHILFHDDDPAYQPGPEIWAAGDEVPSSGITQPPIVAFAVRRLVESAVDQEHAQNKLQKLFPKIMAFHRWFHTHRDPMKTGLVKIIHPWESGRDNSPDWSTALGRVPTDNLDNYERVDSDLTSADERPHKEEYDRYMALVQLFRENDYDHDFIHRATPFKVADIGINAILHRADKDLLWLAGYIDADHKLKDEITEWIDRTAGAFDQLWSEKHQSYCSLDLIDNRHVPVVTSAAFLPFFAGVTNDKTAAALTAKLEQWAQKVGYLVPSYNPDCDLFDRRRYWSGPVWAIINFMIATGMSEQGQTEMADRITHDTAKLIQRSGFMEYYDPIDGTGLGGNSFSWTAAMWLYWLDPALSEGNGSIHA